MVSNVGMYPNYGVNSYGSNIPQFDVNDDYLASMYRIHTQNPKFDIVEFSAQKPKGEPNKKSTLGTIVKIGVAIGTAVLLKKNWGRVKGLVGKLFTKSGKVMPGKAQEALKAAEQISKPSTVTAQTIDNMLEIPKKSLKGAAAAKHYANQQKMYENLFA